MRRPRAGRAGRRGSSHQKASTSAAARPAVSRNGARKPNRSASTPPAGAPSTDPAAIAVKSQLITWAPPVWPVAGGREGQAGRPGQARRAALESTGGDQHADVAGLRPHERGRDDARPADHQHAARAEALGQHRRDGTDHEHADRVGAEEDAEHSGACAQRPGVPRHDRHDQAVEQLADEDGAGHQDRRQRALIGAGGGGDGPTCRDGA